MEILCLLTPTGGGGGGYSNLFLLRRLVPSMYCLPPKNIRSSRHNPSKKIPILYLDPKKNSWEF